MIGADSAILTATFSALSDPTRRAILERLSEGEITVGELAEPLEMSLPAVSKHLKVLGGIPEDNVVRTGDIRGESIFELPECAALKAVAQCLTELENQ